MKTMYSITDELMKINGIPSMKYLAEDLGIEYSILRNRASRNSIPFTEILNYCHSKNIDAMKLFYGDKNGN